MCDSRAIRCLLQRFVAVAGPKASENDAIQTSPLTAFIILKGGTREKLPPRTDMRSQQPFILSRGRGVRRPPRSVLCSPARSQGGGAGSPMSNPYLLSNLSEIQPRRGRQLTRESDHCGDSCSERAPEKKQHVCMCMGSAANSSLWAESLLVTARPKEPQYRKMCAEGILKPW